MFCLYLSLYRLIINNFIRSPTTSWWRCGKPHAGYVKRVILYLCYCWSFHNTSSYIYVGPFPKSWKKLGSRKKHFFGPFQVKGVWYLPHKWCSERRCTRSGFRANVCFLWCGGRSVAVPRVVVEERTSLLQTETTFFSHVVHQKQ